MVCEYLVRVRTKPDLNLVVKCSLTGGVCFCEVDHFQCTRRTFALIYQTKQDRIAQMILIDPKTQLPST